MHTWSIMSVRITIGLQGFRYAIVFIYSCSSVDSHQDTQTQHNKQTHQQTNKHKLLRTIWLLQIMTGAERGNHQEKKLSNLQWVWTAAVTNQVLRSAEAAGRRPSRTDLHDCWVFGCRLVTDAFVAIIAWLLPRHQLHWYKHMCCAVTRN